MLSPRESPIKSFSKEGPRACAEASAAAAAAAGSLEKPVSEAAVSSADPKSISESSLSGPFLTPAPLVPSVPLGMRDAPSTSPDLTRRYRSRVRWMLSLISNSFATASWSSDSSSHIFWILGCALARALDRSFSSQ